MSLQYIREVVVASLDVPAATTFHQDAFGLEVIEETSKDGDVLLGATGSAGGRLRFVAAAPSVTEPPAVWDTGARLLGIYSRDLERTVEAMRDAGGEPRSPVTYPYGATTLSELVGLGSDGIWWTVPLAVVGAHRPSHAYAVEPERLHSEVHSVVLVVDDHDDAVAFFEHAGLIAAFDGSMSGAPYDELIGMPAYAILRLTFMVGPKQDSARLEIMSFEGVRGVDRSADPVGIQRLVFVAEDPDATYVAMLAGGADSMGPRLVRGPVGVEIQLVAR